MLGKKMNEISSISKYGNSSIGGGLGDLFGGGDSKVDKNKIMEQSSTVYSCVNLISSTIAKMTLNLFKETNGKKEKVKDDNSYIVCVRPNEYTSEIDFISAMINIMLIQGQSFAYIDVKKGGLIKSLTVLPQDTQLKKINKKYYVIFSKDNEQYKVDYQKVLHFKDVTLDGINGVSRITAIKKKLETQLKGEEMVNDYYKNGNGVKGFLETPADLSNEAKKKLKTATTSLLTSGMTGIGVLSGGMTYKPVATMSIADSQFLDNMKFTKEDICAIYNINPALLGSSEQATNSNMQEMNNAFLQSLITIVFKIEQEMNYKLLTPNERKDYYYKFNQSTALRASDKDRADYYREMINSGVMNVNECRDKEDLDGVVGGDICRVDLNHVNIEKVDEYQLNRSINGNNNIK